MGNRFCGGREGDGDTGEGGVVAGVGGGGGVVESGWAGAVATALLNLSW